jgi:DNA-binding MarR family transcriptional regulator
MEHTEGLGMQAWRSVLRSHARVTRAVDAELQASIGLSFRSYDLLVRLSRSPTGSLRMSELATLVLLSPSGVTRLVDQLVAKGLVSRRKDPSDARGYLAELTKEGRAMLRKSTRVYEQAIHKHFAERLNDDQMQTIVEALETLAPPR